MRSMDIGTQMKIILPIYYTYEPKKKKFKTIFSGLNEVLDMHFAEYSKMKKHYTTLVRSQIIPGKNKITGKYITHMTIFYKNDQCDAPNAYGVIDKFAMDALQAYDIVDQDNVRVYANGSWSAIEDKKNPRAVIEIKKQNKKRK